MLQAGNLYSISTERQLLPVRWQFLPVVVAIIAGYKFFTTYKQNGAVQHGSNKAICRRLRQQASYRGDGIDVASI